MGCAISEEEQGDSMKQKPSIVHDVEVSGETGFKKLVKARRLLLSGSSQRDGFDQVMRAIVKQHGNLGGQVSEPMQFDPKPGSMVTVDALPRLDLHQDHSGDQILPVNGYQVDMDILTNEEQLAALCSYAGGLFHGVVLCLGADQIERVSDKEWKLAGPMEELYLECLTNLIELKCVADSVPVMILINGTDRFRTPEQTDAEFKVIEHKLCLEMKLTFIECEEMGYSDVKTYGCNADTDNSTDDAIKWLAAKLRKVPSN